MICPKCGADMRVIDTRVAENDSVRRRRACTWCKFRLTTYEITLEQLGRYNRIERDRIKTLNAIKDLIRRSDHE